MKSKALQPNPILRELGGIIATPQYSGLTSKARDVLIAFLSLHHATGKGWFPLEVGRRAMRRAPHGTTERGVHDLIEAGFLIPDARDKSRVRLWFINDKSSA